MILQHYTKNRATTHLRIIEILLDRLGKYDCCSPNTCPKLIADDNKYLWSCYDCYNIFYPEYSLIYIGRKFSITHENIGHHPIHRLHYRSHCPCVVARNSPEILSEEKVLEILMSFAKELMHIIYENKNVGNQFIKELEKITWK